MMLRRSGAPYDRIQPFVRHQQSSRATGSSWLCHVATEDLLVLHVQVLVCEVIGHCVRFRTAPYEAADKGAPRRTRRSPKGCVRGLHSGLLVCVTSRNPNFQCPAATRQLSARVYFLTPPLDCYAIVWVGSGICVSPITVLTAMRAILVNPFPANISL